MMCVCVCVQVYFLTYMKNVTNSTNWSRNYVNYSTYIKVVTYGIGINKIDHNIM